MSESSTSEKPTVKRQTLGSLSLKNLIEKILLEISIGKKSDGKILLKRFGIKSGAQIK